MPSLATAVLDWYATAARDLPWRRPDAAPWGILVSEVMLQQTPVARVLPAYGAWMQRWPTPAALAREPAGEAVRQWGRLGYPRRALRLHSTSVVLVRDHGGEVPRELDALLALPGLGTYTARAVASFAFGQRHAVVDTNVRRVLARAVGGAGQAGPPSAADLRAAEAMVPDDPAVAARYAVAVMELGALVCTARSPRCGSCPLQHECAWRLAGSPSYEGVAPARQTFAGTDRQARGCLLAVLRDSREPVTAVTLEGAWHEPVQRSRALAGLLADGLVRRLPDGRITLP